MFQAIGTFFSFFLLLLLIECLDYLYENHDGRPQMPAPLCVITTAIPPLPIWEPHNHQHQTSTSDTMVTALGDMTVPTRAFVLKQ